MSNKYRHEITWTVDGEPYTLKLTLNDVAVLEQSTIGKGGIVTLFNRMAVENQYGLGEVVTILIRGLQSGMPNKKWKIEDVYDLIEEAGFVEAKDMAIELLTKRLVKPKKEDESGETTDPLAPTTRTNTGDV